MVEVAPLDGLDASAAAMHLKAGIGGVIRDLGETEECQRLDDDNCIAFFATWFLEVGGDVSTVRDVL